MVHLHIHYWRNVRKRYNDECIYMAENMKKIEPNTPPNPRICMSSCKQGEELMILCLYIYVTLFFLCRCWLLWSETLEIDYIVIDWFKPEKQNYHKNGGHKKDGLSQGDSEWYECGEFEMMGMVVVWTWTPLYYLSYIHSKTKICVWFFAWIGNHEFILLFRTFRWTRNDLWCTRRRH